MCPVCNSCPPLRRARDADARRRAACTRTQSVHWLSSHVWQGSRAEREPREAERHLARQHAERTSELSSSAFSRPERFTSHHPLPPFRPSYTARRRSEKIAEVSRKDCIQNVREPYPCACSQAGVAPGALPNCEASIRRPGQALQRYQGGEQGQPTCGEQDGGARRVYGMEWVLTGVIQVAKFPGTKGSDVS